MNKLSISNNKAVIFKYFNKDIKKLKNKKFFVAGGTGYLGLWLIHLLDFLNKENQLNINLTLLVRNKNRKYKFQKLSFPTKYIIGDIKNFKYPNIKYDYIFHLASNSTSKIDNHYDNFSDIIINGTKNVLNFSKKNKPIKFIYFSSGAVYGNTKINKKTFNEKNDYFFDREDKKNEYGLSKLIAENLIRKKFKNYKKNFLIMRIFNIGGKNFINKNFFLPSFCEAVKSNKSIKILSDGMGKRSFIHPIDLYGWIFYLLFNSKENIINATPKEKISIKLHGKIPAFEPMDQRSLN